MENIDELLKRLVNPNYYENEYDNRQAYLSPELGVEAAATIRAQQAEIDEMLATLKMLWMQYTLFVDTENDEIALECKTYVEATIAHAEFSNLEKAQ